LSGRQLISPHRICEIFLQRDTKTDTQTEIVKGTVYMNITRLMRIYNHDPRMNKNTVYYFIASLIQNLNNHKFK